MFEDAEKISVPIMGDRKTPENNTVRTGSS
jgi:hypothetical protein